MSKAIRNHNNRKERRRRIFNILYPSLIVFYIFTFSETIISLFNRQCNDLDYYIEAILLFSVWMILAIHIFSAYTRIYEIYEISQHIYPPLAFFLDCLEVLLVIILLVCIKNSIISQECWPYNYTRIYVFMFFLLLNQIVWFVSLKLHDINAMIRIAIMMVTILALLIWESKSVSILNHAIFISIFVLMAILSLFDKVRNKNGELEP